MSAFTRSEILETLADLKTAIKVVVTGGKSYTLNDGMGTQQVTRSSLRELQSAIDYWTSELRELDGTGNILSVGVRRGDF